MKGRMELVPVILLGSGVALAGCALALMVAKGAAAPPATGIFLLVGIIDGVTGLVWTTALLFSKGAAEIGAGADTAELRAKQTLVMACGIMSVIFLGVVLAMTMYLHVIVSCLRAWMGGHG